MTTTARQEFYQRIDQQHMTPLWEVLGALVPKAPTSPLQAALWRYADVRAHVMEAGRLITAAEAERRVLILENPALPGNSSIQPSGRSEMASCFFRVFCAVTLIR